MNASSLRKGEPLYCGDRDRESEANVTPSSELASDIRKGDGGLGSAMEDSNDGWLHFCGSLEE